MAKNRNTQDSLKTAAKMAKKATPNASQRKKIYKKSGIGKAMPYISMFFALILAICFILVRVAHVENGAGVVGNYIQLFLCGLLGAAAFLLPLLFGYLGVCWCIFNISWPMSAIRENEEEYRRAKKRTVSRSVLSSVAVVIFSVILGVFDDPAKLDIVEVWTRASENLAGGGFIGAPIAYLLTLAFEPVISLVILFIVLAVVVLFAIGITPDYIITKMRIRRELRKENIDFEDDYDEKKLEALKQKELERAKKKRQKQLMNARKAEARRVAEQEVSLQPPDRTLAEDSRRKTAAAQVKKTTVNPEDVTSLVEDLEPEKPNEDVTETIKEPEMTELKLDDMPQDPPKKEKLDASDAFDYGGDKIIDGESGFESLESILNDVAGVKSAEPEMPRPQTDEVSELELGEISKETLSEDMAEVVPEDGKDSDDSMVTPYVFPPIDMLAPNQNPADTDRDKELRETASLLQQTLKSFKVDIEAIQYSRGPTITRYELKPAVGTRVRSIANLVDDIALSLATSGVRIEAPIPNKSAVGIEVPNRIRATVYLRDLIDNEKFTEAKSKLTSCLGMDVGGNPIYFDIAKMPHLLIAGATGMGKSVCINSIIISLLYKARPDDVKLILIDPKKVEFNVYKDIPHLYAPIVSDPKKAAGALASAVAEMERRFELIEEVGVRDITTYNAVTENDPEKEKMPHMVIIIDELADLMMTAPDDVEACICRLAQKARAAGIHIIIGTQRPSVDVITGLIKANIPSRIACTVASQIDSRTIIDISGAEKLIGRGDMLFAPVGAAKPMRVQGAFVSEAEVEKIVSFIKENNMSARYNSDFINSMEENAKNCGLGKKGGATVISDAVPGGEDGGDSKFSEAVKLAIEEGKISTSLMQRRLGVGYGRAAKIIDTMEQLGYVSKPDGNKPRRVLITMQEYMDRASNGTLGGNE